MDPISFVVVIKLILILEGLDDKQFHRDLAKIYIDNDDKLWTFNNSLITQQK